MDYWIGSPGESSAGDPDGMVSVSSGSVIETGGNPLGSVKFLVPWATPARDGEFEEEKEDELYQEYLVEIGTWDSEDEVYIDSHGSFEDWLARRASAEGPVPYYIDGEFTRYRFRLEPNNLARGYVEVSKFLRETQ
jgi:hypothetical protein